MVAIHRAPEVWREMGLTDAEYHRIVELLGREPNEVELGMFAVMWSEHCGYKHSRPVLRLFKRYREALEAQALKMLASCHWMTSLVSPSRLKVITTLGSRALSRRSDGRRGHHPRHLYDGRAPNRDFGFVALWTAY